jgi:hypothetical protein
MDEPRTPDTIEALLIEEITQVLATLELDVRSPSRTASLRAASVEALGRAASRHERLALLYRQLAIRRGQAYRGEAAP